MSESNILTIDELDEVADAVYPNVSEGVTQHLYRLFGSHMDLTARVAELEGQITDCSGPCRTGNEEKRAPLDSGASVGRS